ncbi:biotin transporter BioY [Mesobacillus zeae]|uniref:Biotin transporter n=1 Tax=Mesobacillus zeae TaxID=1917180 RepID=A0A398B8T9_9BACI|nr:biotin transporter BioY [Mesobacillus zeae]RID86282.1 biotin transporter BioY [Mesobacillus zeae]
MGKKFRTIDLTLAAMFVALMAVGANITSFAPFMKIGEVPITLQTFFAILAGVILGARLGAISMGVYTLVGLAGVPVFAKFGAGFSTVVSPTFGFIVSFILTAYCVGKIVEKYRSLPAFIVASLIGLIVNYVFGTNWMYFAMKSWAAAPEGFTYKMAWMWMAVPIPKDIVLSVFAGLVAHRLERSVLSKGSFKHLKNAV